MPGSSTRRYGFGGAGRPALVLASTLALALATGVLRAPTRAQGPSATPAATVHPPLPLDSADYWLIPDLAALPRPAADSPAGRVAHGMRLIAAGLFEEGLPLVRTSGAGASPLASYVRYYEGVALLGLQQYTEAVGALAAAAEAPADSPLRERASLRLAEAALALGDAERAERVLRDLLRDDAGLDAREEALLLLAAAEEAAGHTDHLVAAYERLYYEAPASEQAAEAQDAIDRLQIGAVRRDTYARARGRAERLFAARRWPEARAAFAMLLPFAQDGQDGDADFVALRLAQCDQQLGRHQAARDALRPLLDGSPHSAEARYAHLTSTRALGQRATYVTLVRRLVADHPDSDWAVEALNGLASHYVSAGDEAQADAVYREVYRRYPAHRYAERAAWRIGWRAYKQGQFAEAAALFDRAAAAYPRSDHRPQWLYWSARAHDALDDSETAEERYRLTATDYGNLYHGRLALDRLDARRQPPVPASLTVVATPPPVLRARTRTILRELAAAGLYDDALREVEFARRSSGDSPQLQATVAWLLYHQAFDLMANDRFTALRGAITTMRRAYPQFMAAGGETLPPDVLRIIFPLDYWPLIERYAEAHTLDPYLMAALVAQESTFTAEIRSSANAIGLMQIIPATGRRYASRLGIRNFSTGMLTQPETNVRIGMRYFRDLMNRFGAAHLALAGYNAGEARVDRWIRERPRMPQDEFIEDIPFAETQTYVKRILGSAEDYRRLYGTGTLDPNGPVAATAWLR